MVLAGCRSVVFVLANMAGWMRQSGEWPDLPLAAGGLLYLGVNAAGLLCVWLFSLSGLVLVVLDYVKNALSNSCFFVVYL